MRKNSPIDEVIELSRSPEARVIFQTGVALQYLGAPPGVAYFAPYMDMGKELWRAAEYELHSVLCNKSDHAPREWLQEIVSGDVREVAVAILTVLVASLHVPLSIAVPLAALLLKKQIAAFCRRTPRKPARSVQEIIQGKRPKGRKRRTKKAPNQAMQRTPTRRSSSIFK